MSAPRELARPDLASNGLDAGPRRPLALEVALATATVLLVPLAILSGWIVLYALVAKVAGGAGTATCAIAMIALSAIYFAWLTGTD
ncbi:MAG: hypothetical protein U0575_16215 [Phycisphaerales bacterium]|jgi:hypothetical protein